MCTREKSRTGAKHLTFLSIKFVRKLIIDTCQRYRNQSHLDVRFLFVFFVSAHRIAVMITIRIN